MRSFAILVSTLLAVSFAHPTYYPQADRNESCVKPGPAKVYSYHIHLLYLQTNKQQFTEAF